MKKFFAPSLLVVAALVSPAFAATPTLDGAVTLAEYDSSVGTSDPSTSNYGPWGIHEVFVAEDATNFYLGIRATPEGNFNSTVIVIGNDNAINGIDANAALPAGDAGGGLQGLSLTVGFEVDYIFRAVHGNTDEAYYNGMNYDGEPSPAVNEYLGGGAGASTGGTITVGSGDFTGVSFTFNKASGDQATNVDEGFEVVIPKTLLAYNDATDTIRAAVLYGNGDTNNFSNQQVPAGAAAASGPSFIIAQPSDVSDWQILD